MSYCEVGDLLLGEMPISSALSSTKFISDSADEINVRIGRIYVTPININELAPNSRTVLKIANARLASGRLLMAQAQAAQDDSLNAYARYLINEANNLISSVENNRITLEGATVREDLVDTPAPSIQNVDEFSAVEAFYDEFLGGGAGRPLPVSPVWTPGTSS
jgi:hypothetical protein